MSLKTLLFPDRCVFCDEPVPSGIYCCSRCEKAAGPAGGPARSLAVSPYPSLAVFRYQGGARQAVHRMKFRGDLRAAEYFTKRMATLLLETSPDLPFDLIAFVPMQPVREKQRGYNQAEVLARGISRETGLPVRDLLLRQGTFIQHQLSASFRHKSAPLSFRARPEVSLSGERVLLVDDVVTTGSTALACADLLMELGASGVTVISAAR